MGGFEFQVILESFASVAGHSVDKAFITILKFIMKSLKKEKKIVIKSFLKHKRINLKCSKIFFPIFITS